MIRDAIFRVTGYRGLCLPGVRSLITFGEAVTDDRFITGGVASRTTAGHRRGQKKIIEPGRVRRSSRGDEEKEREYEAIRG